MGVEFYKRIPVRRRSAHRPHRHARALREHRRNGWIVEIPCIAEVVPAAPFGEFGEHQQLRRGEPLGADELEVVLCSHVVDVVSPWAFKGFICGKSGGGGVLQRILHVVMDVRRGHQRRLDQPLVRGEARRLQFAGPHCENVHFQRHHAELQYFQREDVWSLAMAMEMVSVSLYS